MAATLVTRELDVRTNSDERSAVCESWPGGSGMRVNALSQTAAGFTIRMTNSSAAVSAS